MVSTPWHADLNEINTFVSVLFRYAESGTWVSLRSFDQFNSSMPPRLLRGVQINGTLDQIVREATIAAEETAQYDQPSVFCPPIATFTDPWKATVLHLANGLSLSVELDEADPTKAQALLEGILGPVTIVVRSGSEWVDPATGEVHPKVHLHWRLTEPTTTPEEHEQLRHARSLATMLVGGDPTGKPVVHPLRWPGSWNLKTRPRMATIAVLHEAAEINLGDVIDELEAAIEAAGVAEGSAQPRQSSTPEAALDMVRSAMAAIPNLEDKANYHDWITLGYAVWRATGGSDDGFDIWDNWSRLSDKYDAEQNTESTWKAIGRAIGSSSSVHRTAGAGTIFFRAARAGWVRPFPLGGERRDDEAAEPEQQPRSPQALLTMRDLDALPPPVWLVQGLIPDKSLVVPFGPPKSGKTFVVLSFCLHVAADKPWFGYDVTGGAVVYIAGEGTGGLSLRLKAMRTKYEIDIDVPFWVKARAVNFRLENEVADLIALIRATVGNVPVRIVVIDTLARAMPGADENSAQEVGLVIAGCDRIRDELGCTVVPVHHSGKDIAKGARGTSALRGAWDTALEISGSNKRAVMTVADQKEAESGQRLTFRLEEISVGIGRTSLVPVLETGPDVQDETFDQGRPTRDPTGDAGLALMVLRNLLAGPESGIIPPFSGIPPDTRGVEDAVFRRGFYEKKPGEKPGTRRQAYNRAISALQQKRLIGVREPWVWLV